MSRRNLVVIALLSFLPVATAGQAKHTQREVTEIVQLLDLSEATVLADVAAGSGEWTYFLAPRVREVFATT